MKLLKLLTCRSSISQSTEYYKICSSFSNFFTG